jgi:hypothetical protein
MDTKTYREKNQSTELDSSALISTVLLGSEDKFVKEEKTVKKAGFNRNLGRNIVTLPKLLKQPSD